MFLFITEFVVKISSILFVFFFMGILLYVLCRKWLYLWFYIGFSTLCVLLLGFFCIRDQTARMNQLIYLLEYFNLAFLLFLAFLRKIYIKKLIGNIDKTEKILLFTS